VTKYRARNVGIAVALAAGAAILIGIYVASYRKSVDRGLDLVPVYVAKSDIQEGAAGADLGGKIEREDVLRKSVLSGAISDVTQLNGLIAGQTILAGEQISLRTFRPLAQEGVLARLKGNLRAALVPGDNEQLLVGVVKSGDRVDVVANLHYTVQRGQGNEIRRVASRVILRNILVLEDPKTAGGGLGGGSKKAITLAVTDSQAQKLFFAMKNGDLMLILRPVAKPNDSPDSVETIDSVLGDGLGLRQLFQLTGGVGLKDVNGQ